MFQRQNFLGILLIMLLLAGPAPAQVEAAESGRDHDHDQAETVWTCSMHPQIQLPEFGQCPICFMDLIEVPKDAGDGKRQSLRQFTFDERHRQLARVEVMPVIRGAAGVETPLVGKVEYDETRVVTITARMAGRIDTLHVDYTGAPVAKGQAMAEIYSPELLAAQAELIQAAQAGARFKKSSSTLLRDTVLRTEQAAQEKLRLLGLTSGQIEAVVSRGEPQDHITLLAPMGGIVMAMKVSEGMYVQTGAPIYVIADLARLWVVLEAYESDLPTIALGQQVDFQVAALPGRTFEGEVVYVDPRVNEKTRTIQVRLNVENKEGLLKPGMFVRARAKEMAPAAGEELPLLIPVSAPLLTGRRALVYVQLPEQEGVYLGKEVILGPRRGPYYQVISGLEEGELVVTQGNFKIDSAIQLQGRPSMMNPFLVKGGADRSELPTLFLSKVAGLSKIFSSLSAALQEGRTQEAEEEARAFAAQLQGISSAELMGQEKLIWQEMAMRLRGDILLLQEAEGRADRQRLHAALNEDVQELRRFYGLSGGPEGEGSPEEQRTLGHFVKRYFEVQRALAADDLLAAMEAAAQVQVFLPQVVPLLPTPLAEKLTSAGAELAAAQEMEGLRLAFYPLSQALMEAVTRVGVAGTGPVYEQFCPMAFGNTGATWLAEKEEINNPYFGAMMLRCGEVKKQLQQ
ncbi:MAG: efflux RND transporter periplasmic adaptor subunit [Deltaproteobacteria bacterium]|nr:efflux RND transporter periplasmic adaptor subunit [Deltaproteobacteria bacterium]